MTTDELEKMRKDLAEGLAFCCEHNTPETGLTHKEYFLDSELSLMQLLGFLKGRGWEGDVVNISSNICFLFESKMIWSEVDYLIHKQRLKEVH